MHKIHKIFCIKFHFKIFFSEKKLFTPGPLGVNYETKAAMLRDLGSRDVEFMDAIKFIRRRILEIANLPTDVYTMVPMQGSGTYSVEAAIQTMIPQSGGKLLLAISGSYGLRMGEIAKYCNIETVISTNTMVQDHR